MKKFVSFLASDPKQVAQFVVAMNTPLTDSDGKKVIDADGHQKIEDLRYFNGRVVDYDEIGVLVARIHSSGAMLEAYPWSAIRAILTTLPENTKLSAGYDIDAFT